MFGRKAFQCLCYWPGVMPVVCKWTLVYCRHGIRFAATSCLPDQPASPISIAILTASPLVGLLIRSEAECVDGLHLSHWAEGVLCLLAFPAAISTSVSMMVSQAC